MKHKAKEIFNRIAIHNKQQMIPYFKFEEDFVEKNIRCIPMIARFKLDTCGIKVTLQAWSKMNAEERTNLSEYPCSSPGEIQQYRGYLQQIILNRTGRMAQELEVGNSPDGINKNEIPEIVAQHLSECNFSMELKAWQALHDLQRFALIKLSRPGHENKNFPAAMHEFGLL